MVVVVVLSVILHNCDISSSLHVDYLCSLNLCFSSEILQFLSESISVVAVGFVSNASSQEHS